MAWSTCKYLTLALAVSLSVTQLWWWLAACQLAPVMAVIAFRGEGRDLEDLPVTQGTGGAASLSHA